MLKGATVTLKTKGRPIFIAIVPAVQQLTSPDEGASLDLYAPKSDIFNNWEIDVLRDSTFRVGQFNVGYVGTTYAFGQHIPLNLVLLDEPGPGTHTYTVRAKYSGSLNGGYAGALEMVSARLVGREL